MRLRNVKNKEIIMNNSSYLIKDYYELKGKWNKYFKNNNPIYIEIGMGKGKFIIEKALKYPNINFIGIEKYDSVVAKALKKIPEGLNNLVMLRCNALDIDKVFNHEIDHMYLNFSDPWPKTRHHLRRLSSSVFLEKYDQIFKDKKVIEMRTDNRNMFEYSLISLSEYGYTLKKVSLDLHKDEDIDITTEYEDKFTKEGLPIYYLLSYKDVNN